MVTLVTCRAFRGDSPQVAGNSHLPLVLLAESFNYFLDSGAWSQQPQPGLGMVAGWGVGDEGGKGGGNVTYIGRTCNCLAQKRRALLANSLRSYTLTRVYRALRKCGSVPCALPPFLPVSTPCSFRPNRRVPGFSLIFRVSHEIGYHGWLLSLIPPGCVRTRRANAPSGMSAKVARACHRWVRE